MLASKKEITVKKLTNLMGIPNFCFEIMFWAVRTPSDSGLTNCNHAAHISTQENYAGKVSIKFSPCQKNKPHIHIINGINFTASNYALL